MTEREKEREVEHSLEVVTRFTVCVLVRFTDSFAFLIQHNSRQGEDERQRLSTWSYERHGKAKKSWTTRRGSDPQIVRSSRILVQYGQGERTYFVHRKVYVNGLSRRESRAVRHRETFRTEESSIVEKKGGKPHIALRNGIDSGYRHERERDTISRECIRRGRSERGDATNQ